MPALRKWHTHRRGNKLAANFEKLSFVPSQTPRLFLVLGNNDRVNKKAIGSSNEKCLHRVLWVSSVGEEHFEKQSV